MGVRLNQTAKNLRLDTSLCADADLASLPAAVFSQINIDSASVFPGFCDVHVHFREPGFSYKETIRTGSMAAAHGGYTSVFTMPNLSPVPDSRAHLNEQLDLIRSTAAINVLPYGAVTVGERGEALSDLAGMAEDVVAFSDDGRGIQSDSLMRQAMEQAKALGKVIAAHCEVNSLLHGGYIHDGAYAKAHRHRGICSESEWRMIERDLKICEETRCAYHVCHISCKESVDLIRNAKRRGVNVTCETAPHYLVLTEDDLQEDGRFKMNPPLRTKADRAALIEGVLDGTIDMIATDHAPHSAEEKGKGLEKSAFGIVGIETAFPTLYTHLVRPGILSLRRLMDLLVHNPHRRFGVYDAGSYSVWLPEKTFTVDPERFLSKGRATPFAGETLYGVCLLTVVNGNIAYQSNSN